MPNADKPLNPREQKFVDHYLADPTANGTAAARAAGYAGSESVLAATASRLLTRAKVRAAIDAAVEERAERLGLDVSADWILGRLRLEAEREGDGAQHSARVKALSVLARYRIPPQPARIAVEHTAHASLLFGALEAIEAKHRGEPPRPPIVTPECVRQSAEDYARRNGKK